MEIVHFFFDSFWSAHYFMLILLALCIGGFK